MLYSLLGLTNGWVVVLYSLPWTLWTLTPFSSFADRDGLWFVLELCWET